VAIIRAVSTRTGSRPTPNWKPTTGTGSEPSTRCQTSSWVSISVNTVPRTCTSMAARSAPGSFGSCSFAPRNAWQIRKPPQIAVVVIQMSMPNLATSVSQTGRVR